MMAKNLRNIVVVAVMLSCAVFLTGISDGQRTKVASGGQAEAPTGAAGPKPRVLVEAIIVQLSTDALAGLQLETNVEPSSEITVPLPVLLYVLADPNAVKTIASAKVLVRAGETGKVNVGQKVKYLVKTNDDSFEQRTTDTPIGTILETTPVIDKDGDIILDLKFEHFAVIPPKEIDPQTSLPIGEPMTDATTVNTRIKLRSGEPAIVGGMGMTTSALQQFVLVRADIIEGW